MLSKTLPGGSMDISKVNSSPNVLPQTKPSPRLEEALETRAQKLAEKVKGEMTTLQLQPQSKQSSQPVVESKQPAATEGPEKQKKNGGFDTLV
jgi:hypothetical protein